MIEWCSNINIKLKTKDTSFGLVEGLHKTEQNQTAFLDIKLLPAGFFGGLPTFKLLLGSFEFFFSWFRNCFPSAIFCHQR